jgi:hypothetical protein
MDSYRSFLSTSLINGSLSFSSGASHCFDDPPLPTRQWPTEPSLLLSRLPGVVYDGDKQCEYIYATSDYKKCPGKLVSALFFVCDK